MIFNFLFFKNIFFELNKFQLKKIVFFDFLVWRGECRVGSACYKFSRKTG